MSYIFSPQDLLSFLMNSSLVAACGGLLYRMFNYRIDIVQKDALKSIGLCAKNEMEIRELNSKTIQASHRIDLLDATTSKDLNQTQESVNQIKRDLIDIRHDIMENNNKTQSFLAKHGEDMQKIQLAIAQLTSSLQATDVIKFK